MTTRSICFLLAVGVLTLIVWSCVDVPTGGQSPPDYHALARFIDAAADGAGGPVTVDGTPVTTLVFAAGSVYIDVPAGGRDIGFGSTVQKVNLRSNSQNTVVVFGLTGSNRFTAADEGYSFKNNGGGDPALAQVKFIHAAFVSAPQISFFDSAATGTAIKTGVGYGTSSGYANLSAGTHTIYVVSNGEYVAAFSGSQEPPAGVATNTTGSGTLGVTAADSAAYSIVMHCDPSDSLYTAGHFHVGPAGVSGPVVVPINVTGQVIGFPGVRLTGGNDVPANAAIKASGTGTFKFSRDGLAFSITTTKDTLDTLFLAGGFYNAAAGSAGPLVRSISLSPVGDTTLAGTWKSTDSQPLTAALISELLNGRIYVRFAVAPGHVGGGIRAQLVPDTSTVNVFSGTWTSLTADIKDSIVAGHVYANFHTARNPGGRVRGQFAVDSAKGQYGVGSLPATTLTGARMYTVVATGSGKSLGLFQLSDRQLGVTKVAAVGGSNAAVRNLPKKN